MGMESCFLAKYFPADVLRIALPQQHAFRVLLMPKQVTFVDKYLHRRCRVATILAAADLVELRVDVGRIFG